MLFSKIFFEKGKTKRLYNKCWGKPSRAYEEKIEIQKKVEHNWKKSVKMELKEETMNGGTKYAL